ncbi:NmrA family NAD(P)-binding protein [Pseudactinotalea suaedae]|uniref:NmrA family NAD(P)-binding protein n=1 Tax=Pseudactinotalea suaedae TaxID=1524924 RepID=UPI0012E26594|nr:NAD(P)H-binding protein [Pseudactinotalea suaedae]
MYTITGVTGHVGGAAARALLERGAPVRVVVRSAEKGAPWADRGAEVAVADLDDPVALAELLRGSDGAFVLLPTLPTGGDAEHRRMAGSISEAVAAAGVPHVVALSSLGAELAEGTGPIRWLHHLETGLGAGGAVVTVLRCCHFQEKVETVLGAVLGAGIYPVFGESADVPTPMVATHDIGEVVARSLLAPPASSEVIDVLGPTSTEREVADLLAEALGRPLQLVTIPREAWVPSMLDAGLPDALAREFAALYEAEARGLLQPQGDRTVHGTTPLRDTLHRVLAAQVTAA